MVRRVLAVCAVLWVFAPPSLGSARARPAIEWSAPPECPDGAQVQARLERLLGRAPPPRFDARVHVERSATGYRAQVEAASGERTFEDPRCDVLADAVATVLAFSIAPGRDDAPPEDATPSDHVRLAALAGGVGGVLPTAAAGFAAELGYELAGTWRIALRGAVYLQQTANFDAETAGADFGMSALSARGCYAWTRKAWQLAPCVGVDVARVSGSGFGGTVSRDRATAWWGPSVGIQARLQLADHFALVLLADAVAAVVRKRFVFSDAGLLHQPAPIAVQLFVGPEVRL